MSMRSAWNDPDALVVALQAGQNRDGAHRHLDLGSFILDALGERWIMDSGIERQAYQRHRNKRQRWEFYRLRAEGHNTLVIDPDSGPDQALDAFAAIEPSYEGNRVSARVDLSAAYRGKADRVVRTLTMVDRRAVIIEDQVTALKPVEMWWFLHTEARITLDPTGRSATLHQNGKQVTVQIEEPSKARLQVMEAAPLPTSPVPEQASNEGRRKLAVHLPGTTDLKLVVHIAPQWE
jgi:hypothetical protein